jgi:Phage protein (N4 Gp49/phage Sf6 gene 66) family
MNHITSPRTDDDAVEQMIKAKGLTAPRVTPADIEANIASVHYFTAADAVAPSPSLDKMVDRFLGWKLPKDFHPDCGISFKSESDFDHPEFGRTKFEPMGTNLFHAGQAREMFEHVIGEQDAPQPLMLLTFCVIVLSNGFTVTGESACASPENFNAEIGRKIALGNAKQKIWPSWATH